MAKKPANTPSQEGEKVEVKQERIALVMKNFRQIVQGGPLSHHRTINGYVVNQIVRNESLIDDLLLMDAPIKVYYRDVD